MSNDFIGMQVTQAGFRSRSLRVPIKNGNFSLTGVLDLFLETGVSHSRDLVGCISGYLAGSVHDHRITLNWRRRNYPGDDDMEDAILIDIFWKQDPPPDEIAPCTLKPFVRVEGDRV